MLHSFKLREEIPQIPPPGFSVEVWEWYCTDKMCNQNAKIAFVEIMLIYKDLHSGKAEARVLARLVNECYNKTMKESCNQQTSIQHG